MKRAAVFMRTPEQSVGQVVLGKGLTREGLPASGVVPAPPPMRVVTKGWWTLRTEYKTVDELDRADNAGRRFRRWMAVRLKPTPQSTSVHPPQGRGLTRLGQPASGPAPVPPPMQVVTKGWWTLRTEYVLVDELGQADRARR